MQFRRFGRNDWQVSEIGVGTWGMGAQWGPVDDGESQAALAQAVELGCNFFDTALAYGDGHSERLVSDLPECHAGRPLYVATKIPPKNYRWPPRREDRLDDIFPRGYIRECTERSLENLDRTHIDLMQFHVWEDAWAHDERWQKEVRELTDEGLVTAWGISLNRWEPWNGLETLRLGIIDSVQVIYNIFDQAPEDELFPLCRDLDVAVIARVPLDEGSLVGALTEQSRWPEDDWRHTYFGPENLPPTLTRVDALWPLVPDGMTLAELALRFILANPDVSTVIPGMRHRRHVRSNLAVSDGYPLPSELLDEMRKHRWDREPAEWLL